MLILIFIIVSNKSTTTTTILFNPHRLLYIYQLGNTPPQLHRLAGKFIKLFIYFNILLLLTLQQLYLVNKLLIQLLYMRLYDKQLILQVLDLPLGLFSCLYPLVVLLQQFLLLINKLGLLLPIFEELLL